MTYSAHINGGSSIPLYARWSRVVAVAFDTPRFSLVSNSERSRILSFSIQHAREKTDELDKWGNLQKRFSVVYSMEVKHILSELAAVPDGTFLDVAGFNEHHIGACSVTGVSPVWEMHPDTDEFFFVIEGTFEVTILTDTGPEHRLAPAGSTLVIPRGLWHKPAAPGGAKFLYFTPGQSLHSEAEDPRSAVI